MKKIGFGLIVLLTIAAMELISMVLVNSGYVPAHVPTYSLSGNLIPLWGDINPHFGVWHPADITYRHKAKCFDVLLETNSYGAIDKEREKRSKEPRVVVLGDSFAEGLGVETKDRFTDLLETKTGKGFLNFGTSGHFGPTQYWQLYEHLAKDFDHDEVWILLVPDNDFLDEYPRSGRYQPYLEGKYPDYELKYTLDKIEESTTWIKPNHWNRYIREFSYAANVVSFLRSRGFDKKSEMKKGIAENQNYRGYNDYKSDELLKLRYVLQQIHSSMGNRKLKVITVPRVYDFEGYDIDEKPRLVNEFQAMASDIGFEYLDLMQFLYTNDGSKMEKLYLDCNGHWTVEGHEDIAEILLTSIKD